MPPAAHSRFRALGPSIAAVPLREALRAGLGAALGLAVATGCALAFSPDLRLGIYLIAPFGASSVLLFAAPNSPLAQPWAAIVGNTVAMNVRERTHEYGVMRAIGFGARSLCALVLGEAALLGMLGAGIGLAISYPLFESVVSRVLQEAMNFPPIVIPRRVAWLALTLGAALSLLSGLVPMLRVGQLRVTDALRKIG